MGPWWRRWGAVDSRTHPRLRLALVVGVIALAWAAVFVDQVSYTHFHHDTRRAVLYAARDVYARVRPHAVTNKTTAPHGAVEFADSALPLGYGAG